MCDTNKTDSPSGGEFGELHARERLEKAAYAQQAVGLDKPSRVSLDERLYSVIRRAREDASRAHRAEELRALLSKNPGIGRILDLYEEFKNY